MRDFSDVAIIGAGPAGLGIARLLSEGGRQSVRVFERSGRAGGKAHTLYLGSGLIEMGTCYLTPGYKWTRRWMDELSITPQLAGSIDTYGLDFIEFIKGGSGPPLALQVATYLLLREQTLRSYRFSGPKASGDRFVESTAEWLDRHKLGKIHRLMLRAITSLGYGLLDEVCIYQSMLWLDADMLFSGITNKLSMPEEGWSEFWSRMASKQDVRLNCGIVSCERTPDRVVLQSETGEIFEAKAAVVTTPMDEWVRIATPSQSESEIAAAFTWKGYTTTLLKADKWFEEARIRVFPKSLLRGAVHGKILSARRESYSRDFGGELYVAGQLPGVYMTSELQELLLQTAIENGAINPQVIDTYTWKYFPQADLAAIGAGLYGAMDRLQGQQNTFYSGATFAHESVRGIDRHNAWLAPKILNTLRR